MRKKQRGFSLIEIMMAVAMLGGLSLVLLQLSKQSASVSRSAETSTEVQSFIYRVRTLMSDKAICELNFKGKAVAANYTNLLISAGNPVIEVGKTYGNNLFKINQIRTIAGSIAQEMFLEIEIERLGNSLSAKTLTKRVPLSITLVSGVVASCYENTNNIIATAVEEAVQQVCLGEGLDYNPVTKTCDVEQTHSPSSVNCAAGEALTKLSYNSTTRKYRLECETVLNIPNCSGGNVLTRTTLGLFVCTPRITSAEIDTAISTINEGAKCGLKLVGGKIKLDCSACVPSPSCAQNEANVCQNVQAPNDSCGNKCSFGNIPMDHGCAAPSSLCSNGHGGPFVSSCGQACNATKDDFAGCPQANTLCSNGYGNTPKKLSQCAEECPATKSFLAANWQRQSVSSCNYDSSGCLTSITYLERCVGVNQCTGPGVPGYQCEPNQTRLAQISLFGGIVPDMVNPSGPDCPIFKSPPPGPGGAVVVPSCAMVLPSF